ncbi:energy-coupling factor ABC transporter ATP-binding protein [Lysinibacillus fusiformis]|jgi:energy-coupling factor transport system ATP-binding protein|uniref:energy-coupling factor ABC transporter ATP-binding protein n=1 Tax=Lysinibacillus TaxID=400634 RepID=UPI0004D3D38F|nr:MULTISPECIES: energy-coupling factor ABC transporter ATP-binding protein [Lysinibacillus]AJK85905.1 cobalt transporter ATP-binding subunit [Lysinibacillus fusiformis]KAB0447494.1 energy-coupling factor transporter ATPase [Lysinibacillus fusiformis]KEK11629.1 cobalt transporter ATP-binding subunit [Lysinibacillus sphaericus]KHK50463.1 cobalt transporter ATP-binding subunit [Lysinibacillus sp. A1]MCE4045814.1 energy-coupling factor ABC transporter ATP-binding protein [Lysinibacillus fusiformi
MPEILSLNNVTFSYTPEEPTSRNAVENVSFAVEEGEWIAIVGHNGSGKSTIAKLMNGLLFPQKGDVRILREPLSEENLWESRSLMGMVFQNPDNQFVGATVQDDVAFALENNGVPFEEMVQRVHAALEQVKMSHFLDHEPHHLSGGQKQRVAIAGALALKPKLLILDEATSMLDPQGRGEVLQTVQTLRAETGLTVLSITHDLEEAMLADRVLFMNDGKKFAEGIPAEIFALGDKLVEFGLDLPFALKLSKLLQKEGVPLMGQHMTEEELVNDLWTSNFNK